MLFYRLSLLGSNANGLKMPDSNGKVFIHEMSRGKR